MPIAERNIDEWLDLIEAEPDLAYRMLTVRWMIEERELTGTQIGEAVGITRQRVNQALRPRTVNYGQGYRPNTMTVASTHRLLDRIEDGITAVSVPPTTQVRADMVRMRREAMMTDADST